MSRIKQQHQSAVGQTGWALFDWNNSDDSPQLAFVAGCCDAARVQMDRYRRHLQAWNRNFHWQVFAWSTRDFALTYYNQSENVYGTFRANCRPQSTQIVDTQINAVRELRGVMLEQCFTPFFAIVDESWANNFTSAKIQYQNSNVFYSEFSLRGTAEPTALRRSYLSAIQFSESGFATVRILLVAFNNSRWEMGAGYP
jgi:hypothetical protein